MRAGPWQSDPDFIELAHRATPIPRRHERGVGAGGLLAGVWLRFASALDRRADSCRLLPAPAAAAPGAPAERRGLDASDTPVAGRNGGHCVPTPSPVPDDLPEHAPPAQDRPRAAERDGVAPAAPRRRRAGAPATSLVASAVPDAGMLIGKTSGKSLGRLVRQGHTPGKSRADWRGKGRGWPTSSESPGRTTLKTGPSGRALFAFLGVSGGGG